MVNNNETTRLMGFAMSTRTDASGQGSGADSRSIRAPSLTELVYREIESMILARELETGERLNDSHLARRFGISRGPVREAIGRLGRPSVWWK